MLPESKTAPLPRDEAVFTRRAYAMTRNQDI